MLYLIPLALIVAFLGFTPPKYGLQHHNHKNYIWICGVLIALVSGLRTPYTGSGDNSWYVFWYQSIQSYESFRDYYDANLAKYDFFSSEAGFYFTMWFFGHFFKDGQMAIVISSLLVTVATCLFIYRNSSDVPLSLTIYICLGLFTFNMNGMRQAMAMSVCLFAYEFAKKQKIIPFVLTVLLAMLYHKTAMCFFPVFILPKLKNNILSWIIYVIGLALCLLYIDQIIEGYYLLSGEDYTENSLATGGGLFVILLYLGAIVLTVFNKQILTNVGARTALLATLAGFTAYISRFVGKGILERVSYYYFYFPMLLIPEAFNALEEKERQIVKILFVIGAVLLFSYRIWNSDFDNFKPYFL